ncbi:MAG: Peptidase, family [Patescibacteria group bacterium]|jgi:murein DD-endopeptidase MepM/ murein hydrolase activator NlpD|nr:Peptidase, family [Patescibacteria group bacterium]
MKYETIKIIFISCIFSVNFLTFGVNITYGQTTNDLLNKIEEKNNEIKKLEEEIKQYNLEVDSASKQAVTLKNTLKTLDLTKKKITTDINLTENKINKTALTIEQLGSEINKTENSIDTNKIAIINAIKEVQSLEDINIMQILLSNKNISEIWTEIDYIQETQNVIRDRSKELVKLKSEMEVKQNSLRGQKTSLVNLKEDLNGKKLAVVYTAKEKENLLTQTKNKEETFKQLVKTTEEKKAQFEKEVYEYESQLNLLVDKSKYPAPKNGVLSWPLDNVFITQKFGKTVDSQKLYVSGSHNGVDFRASVGTKIKNVLDGTVVGTGNTDLYPGCYSFGKWVMVKHDNGLSTIYGHMSVISTVMGQRLLTGDLVGYSGNTGYSTGPHLHISLYATQGVRIEKYVNSRGCKQVTMPLADIKAYLDPLAYLPAI